MSRRLLHLDVVRGVAILLVLLLHTAFPVPRPDWYSPVSWLAASGGAGVDLFFALSGFLIGGLLFREREKNGTIDAPRFLIRRAFKTLPTYYVFLGTFALTYVAFGTRLAPPTPARLTEVIQDLWPTLIHCQNYFPSTSEKLGWLWSLAVEEHFYLFLALALAGLTRRNPQPGNASIPGFWLLFIGVASVCPLARALNSTTLMAPAGASHLRFDSLFTGVALAYWVKVYPTQLLKMIPWRWLILGCGVALFFLHRVSFGHPPCYPAAFDESILAVASALLVLSAYLWDRSLATAVNPAPSRSRFPLRHLIAWIGVRSYSIYIWHGWFSRPIANRLTQGTALDPTGSGLGGVGGEMIFILVAIGLGALSFWLIENPCLALRERWFGAASKTQSLAP